MSTIMPLGIAKLNGGPFNGAVVTTAATDGACFRWHVRLISQREAAVYEVSGGAASLHETVFEYRELVTWDVQGPPTAGLVVPSLPAAKVQKMRIEGRFASTGEAAELVVEAATFEDAFERARTVGITPLAGSFVAVEGGLRLDRR